MNDGIRAANTDFRDYPNNGIGYNWGVAGRAEFKVMGDWSDYNQLTAYHNKNDLLVIGVGADYSEAGKDSQLSHTLDIQYGGTVGPVPLRGLLRPVHRHNIGLPNGGPISTTYLSRRHQRPGHLRALDPGRGRLPHQPEVGAVRPLRVPSPAGTPPAATTTSTKSPAALNYYFKGHNLKFTGEVMYLPRASRSTTPATTCSTATASARSLAWFRCSCCCESPDLLSPPGVGRTKVDDRGPA